MTLDYSLIKMDFDVIQKYAPERVMSRLSSLITDVRNIKLLITGSNSNSILQSLNSITTSLVSQINNNTSQIQAIQTNLSSGGVTTNANITNLQTSVAANANSINTLQTSVNTNTNNISTLNSQVNTNTTSISNINAQLGKTQTMFGSGLVSLSNNVVIPWSVTRTTISGLTCNSSGTFSSSSGSAMNLSFSGTICVSGQSSGYVILQLLLGSNATITATSVINLANSNVQTCISLSTSFILPANGTFAIRVQTNASGLTFNTDQTYHYFNVLNLA